MTPRRWWGVAVLGAAVVMFTQAGTVCCTPAERAPIESGLQAALSTEKVGCLLKKHAGLTADDHGLCLVLCQIAPPLEQAALSLLDAADVARAVPPPDGGGQ